jgi:citrate synthase
MTEKRRTSISWVEAERIVVRGSAIEDLIGNVTFAEAIFLVLRGERPGPEEARLFESILVAIIDHGVRPPSTIAAVTVANTGAELNASVAAGILAINRFHGGAVEESMNAIRKAFARRLENRTDAMDAARATVAEFRESGERISGFGHRFHAADPRTGRLFALAAELGLSRGFVEQARALERALAESTGRNLRINADGAIAALLLELRFPPQAANGVFMIGRVPGLVAHAVEERESNPPMRTVSVEDYEYVGETPDPPNNTAL